ncbi:ribosomal protein S18 [Glonium stellatum]|uniref:Small ribosomal subunit protein bS18m n=1 Tax=Glonium stellatum TaxID=574774 RepID=A0A8E2FA53_9PEZI|nr:ribosomal protein S18 [Glonium stellatum]
MSLFRPSCKLPGSIRGNCARLWFSSSSRNQSQRTTENLLSTLDEPSTYSKPSAATANSSQRTGSTASFARRALKERRTTAAHMEEIGKRKDYETQMWRKWEVGDVYAPHDLTGPEQAKWKKSRQLPKKDAFDALGINPLNEYKNFSMMSEYMTEMGRIKHSSETGLRPVNQRKIAKAIRRAIGIGLMPSVHKHPEILQRRQKKSR